MKRPYYLFSNGRLRRRQNTLFFEKSGEARQPDDAPDDEGQPSTEPTGERVPVPVEQVESLYLLGEVDLNSKLVTFLAQHDVPTFFFDYYGNYTATLYPRATLHSGRLRVDQARHYLHPKKRMRLARSLVEAAAYNLLRVLKYYRTRLSGEAQALLDGRIYQIETHRKLLRQAADVPALMGMEGMMREGYYRVWPTLLGEAGTAFPFERRERNPPSNELNALISFGNALCYSTVLRQIHRTALDPTISFLHEPGDRRFSLALDLAEVFKPLLVDRAIFRLIKTGAIQPRHFEPRLGGVYLNEKGRRVFVEHWDERLGQTIQHRTLNRPVSYERLVRLECYKLVRHLCDPKNDPYVGFRLWW
jgi:CRISPR-associated protein Cas1